MNKKEIITKNSNLKFKLLIIKVVYNNEIHK